MEIFAATIAAGVVLLISAWLIFGDRPEAGEPKSDLEYRAERLGATFEELEDLGYDTDAPLAWSYVFMDRDYEPLSRLIPQLTRAGYELVVTEEIAEPENEFTEHKVVFRRLEHHTQETLAARNIDFRQLAASQGIDLYDGSWVVDPDAERDADDA